MAAEDSVKRETCKLEENMSALRTERAAKEEESMYPLILSMCYSDEYV
jgi:hypothetical protein